MAKWAFDDNVPKARPRMRLGKVLGELETVAENVTEPPPVRPRAEPAIETAPEPEVAAAEAELPAPVEAKELEAAPEPIAEEADALRPAPEETTLVASSLMDQEDAVEHLIHTSAVPAVGEATSLPAERSEEPEAPVVPMSAAPVAAAPLAKQAPAPAADPIEDPQADARRASLKRRAAGLGALPEPVLPPPSPILDELDALASTAELASELQRALDAAAESNEQLRGDLNAALDDLARSTAESKRLHERVERLEAESRDRAKVVQDLVRELELLEGERDSALTQAADAQLEIERHGEKTLLLERRIHELERGLADAQARNKRFEEAAQAQAAQRAALRTEIESLRRERDSLLVRTAELEREREELGRSRKALDEVHRALSEARQRAQRIRPR